MIRLTQNSHATTAGVFACNDLAEISNRVNSKKKTNGSKEDSNCFNYEIKIFHIEK